MMSRLFIAVVVLILGLAGRAPAATIPMTIEEMMAVADQVVAVRVESTDSFVRKGKIYTTARFRVVERYKGNLKGEQEMTYLGGQWRDLVMAVPGVPRLESGEEAILFLSRPLDRLPKEERARFDAESPVVQSYQIVGGHLGKFTIVDEDGGNNAQKRTRTAEAAIPADLGVQRSDSSAIASGKPAQYTFGDFRTALRGMAVAQEKKLRERGAGERIAGIRGTFAIPDRTDDPVIRSFDPLPSMAYLDDQGVAELEVEMRRQAAQAAKTREADDRGADEHTPQE